MDGEPVRIRRLFALVVLLWLSYDFVDANAGVFVFNADQCVDAVHMREPPKLDRLLLADDARPCAAVANQLRLPVPTDPQFRPMPRVPPLARCLLVTHSLDAPSLPEDD